MATAKTVIDVILGEAVGEKPGWRPTEAQRLDDMKAIASVIYNRANGDVFKMRDVISGRKQFHAYGKALPPGAEKYRALADQALREILDNGPVTDATYYATPSDVGYLPKGLAAATETVGHKYFTDPQQRPFVTASGTAKAAPQVASEGNISFAHADQTGIDPRLEAVLKDTSVAMGMPLSIMSGKRSRSHYAERNKKGIGQHVHGVASDISMRGLSEGQRAQLVSELHARGAKRFITYDRYPDMLHVDLKKQGGKNQSWFMHNGTSKKIGSAPGWFQAVAKRYTPIAPGSPESIALLSTAPRITLADGRIQTTADPMLAALDVASSTPLAQAGQEMAFATPDPAQIAGLSGPINTPQTFAGGFGGIPTQKVALAPVKVKGMPVPQEPTQKPLTAPDIQRPIIASSVPRLPERVPEPPPAPYPTLKPRGTVPTAVKSLPQTPAIGMQGSPEAFASQKPGARIVQQAPPAPEMPQVPIDVATKRGGQPWGQPPVPGIQRAPQRQLSPDPFALPQQADLGINRAAQSIFGGHLPNDPVHGVHGGLFGAPRTEAYNQWAGKGPINTRDIKPNGPGFAGVGSGPISAIMAGKAPAGFTATSVNNPSHSVVSLGPAGSANVSGKYANTTITNPDGTKSTKLGVAPTVTVDPETGKVSVGWGIPDPATGWGKGLSQAKQAALQAAYDQQEASKAIEAAVGKAAQQTGPAAGLGSLFSSLFGIQTPVVTAPSIGLGSLFSGGGDSGPSGGVGYGGASGFSGAFSEGAHSNSTSSRGL